MTGFGRRWAVILAGGDGTRLRPLTRELAGDDRPKQFCRVLGSETLLEQTRRRVARAVSPLRTLVVVTRRHQPYYRELLADLPPHAVLVQPENRGTLAGILYPLLRLETVTGEDAVALFPSDHYVSDDGGFMAHVEAAFDAVGSRPELTALLGIRPDRPETGYGWIELGPPVVGRRGADEPPLRRVRRFWEKPGPALAAVLKARGCLWNSFVVVARIRTLVALTQRAAPDVHAALAAAAPTWGGGAAAEARALARIYGALRSRDFSREVLARHPEHLGVVPVSGVSWNDLGEPARVFATRRAVERRAPAPLAVGL